MNGTQTFTDALKALWEQFSRQDGEPRALDPSREALISAIGLYVAVGIAIILMQGAVSAIGILTVINHGPVVVLIALSAAYAAFRKKSERIPALVFFILITQIVVFFLSLFLNAFSFGAGIIVGLLLALNFVAFKRVLKQSTGEALGVSLVVTVLMMGFAIWMISAIGLGQAVAGI